MVLPKKLTYEECRQQRLEENKQRMEALNLPLLSQALRRFKTPTPSPMKKVKPRTVTKQVVMVRRSSRLANTPSPVYKEIVVDRVEIPRRVSCSSKHRDFSNRVYASNEDREDAIERAEKLLSTLEGDHPYFIRSMLPSHVSGGFWLGLPSSFCRSSLPKRDEVMTLVDEEGKGSPTIYLARKFGLSGGWKGFAVAHDLADGDALIFQLVNPTTFKVYITRVNKSDKTNNNLASS